MTDAGGELAEQAARLSARAGQVALCLDFDGTLSPIVPDPEAARPLEGVVELLGRLAARFAAVALVSGRPADYLAEHAGAPGCATWACTGSRRSATARCGSTSAWRPAGRRWRPPSRTCGTIPRSATAAPGWKTSDMRLLPTPAGSLIPTAGRGRSTSPPARSPPGTAWRWSRASWSGSCARRCPATTATPSARWSPPAAPAR
jgi:hypothetical protein